jgi:dethiobiotin synthetase
MPFTNTDYEIGKLVTTKRIIAYFQRNVGNNTVTYWKPFKFGSHMYIMTFDNNLYQVD